MAVEGHPMTRCDFDPRPGGTFHFEWQGPGGSSFFFSGPVLEVRAPHHITHIEHFNGDRALAARITTDLAASGTGTRMTMVMRYASSEARAAAIATGMTDGMDEVYARLDAMQIA